MWHIACRYNLYSGLLCKQWTLELVDCVGGILEGGRERGREGRKGEGGREGRREGGGERGGGTSVLLAFYNKCTIIIISIIRPIKYR